MFIITLEIISQRKYSYQIPTLLLSILQPTIYLPYFNSIGILINNYIIELLTNNNLTMISR